jgi:hypothetical protein
MKRSLIILLAITAFLIAVAASARIEQQRAPLPQCAASIAECPLEGCSADNHHDGTLNRLKNITSNNSPVTDRSITWMKTHPDPKTFQRGGPRDELTSLDEGKQLRVVGYLLRAKLELGGESCNCYLRTEETTDNHLVVVDKPTLDEFPLPGNPDKQTIDSVFKQRGHESITAEFTPRVRMNGHPKFRSETLEPLIADAPQRALLVRITGQLMFDSEHFFQNHLSRVTNWELHPIFRLEYCPNGKTCEANSDANWKDIDR